MSYSNPMGDQVGWESGAEAGMPRTPAPPFYDPTMPPLIEPPVIEIEGENPNNRPFLPGVEPVKPKMGMGAVLAAALVFYAISRG